ncbi:ABC transporter substrate-binding protein [Tenggerimyces flavus]|uniref:ABC transporter substrate-binding protein n=1 Tax=Tenggerimyces flavus TaxID=1708749 RepID=A0ABV7YFA9_9ACTN|nr:extracellular solute-binding protein [Tenggerimyces flavus]MBM7789286.1 raffinose/stachyose/melibiose transport system substrate-binding protein [Tenggerimyces flavus]
MRRRQLLAAAGLALLPGCATVAAPGGGSSGSGPEDSSKRLRILAGRYPYTDAVLGEFRQRNPGLTAAYTEGGVSFEEGSAQTLLRSGRSPDVILVNSGPGRVGLLARNGLIAPLDDVLARTGFAERYQDAVIEQTRSGPEGKIYEVVEGLDVFQVYYNKDLFAKHGATVPTTWQGFLDTCAALKKGDVSPIVAGVRDNFAGGWLLGSLVQAAAGRELMTEVIYGDGAFDDPSIVQGGQLLKDLLDAGYLDGRQAAALDGEQANAAFLKGSAAMIVVPQSQVADAAYDGEKVDHLGAFPMPPTEAGMPALPTAGLAVSWVVNNATKARSAVAAWLDWISSEDYLRLAAKNGLTLVPSLKLPAGITMHPIVADGFAKSRAGTGYNPSVYLPDTAKDAWYQAVQGIITGSLTPQQAMADVQRELVTARNGARR